MIQKTVIIMTGCLGVACIAFYFIFITPSQHQKPEKPLLQFKVLQLDTSQLGSIAPLKNGGIVAGNRRGELRIFTRIEPGAEPQIYKVSPYAISAPALEKEGVFYVGDESGRFWAYTPETGVKWFNKTGNQITGHAIWSDGMVFVGSHNHCFYAFDPETGDIKYCVDCDGEINGSPLFFESSHTIVFGSCDGILRKIDAQTGDIVAQLDFESMIPDTPAIYDGIIYVLTSNGDIAAVDPESFEIQYRVSSKSEYYFSPYATNNFLFLTDSNGKINVHSRKNGNYQATLDAEEKMTQLQAGDDSRVFAVSICGKLYEWCRKKDQWHPTFLADCQADCRRSCVLLDNKLFVVDDSGGLFYYEITQ